MPARASSLQGHIWELCGGMTGLPRVLSAAFDHLGFCLQAAAAVRPRNRPLVVLLEGAEGTGASALKDLIILLAEVCFCLLQHETVLSRSLQGIQSCSFQRAQPSGALHALAAH